MQNQELDLSAYSSALRRAVPKMLAVGLLFGALGVLATYFSKPTWEAEASLLMDSKPPSSTGLEGLLQQDSNPLNVLKGIVRSRTALERIAKKTGVERNDLEEALAVQAVSDANQLTIGVKWKGQEKALAIVGAAVDVLEGMKREIGFGVASRQARMLEKAIGEKGRDLAKAEDQLRDYLKSMKSFIDPASSSSILDLMRQRKELETELEGLRIQLREARSHAAQAAGTNVEIPSGLPNAIEWQQRLSKAAYDLQIARVKDGDGSPTVVRLKRELEVTRERVQTEIANYYQSVRLNLDGEVAKLEAQRLVTEWRLQGVREMAEKAPGEGQELNRRVREVNILTTVLTNLRQQYELKQIDAAGDVSWSVLETPHLTEDEPINKKFGRNGFLGFLVGAGLAGLIQILSQRRRSTAQRG